MDKFLTATEARQQFLKFLEEVREGDRVIIRAAHDEVKAGRMYRLKGAPTVKRLVSLARSKGLLKRHGG